MVRHPSSPSQTLNNWLSNAAIPLPQSKTRPISTILRGFGRKKTYLTNDYCFSSGLVADEVASFAAAFTLALKSYRGAEIKVKPVTNNHFLPENIVIQYDENNHWQVGWIKDITLNEKILTGHGEIHAFTDLLFKLVNGSQPNQKVTGEALQHLAQSQPEIATTLIKAQCGKFSSIEELAGAFGWSVYRHKHLSYLSAPDKVRKVAKQRVKSVSKLQLPGEVSKNPGGSRLTLGLGIFSLAVALILMLGVLSFPNTTFPNNSTQVGQKLTTRALSRSSTITTFSTTPLVSSVPTPATLSQTTTQSDGSIHTRYNAAYDQDSTYPYINPLKLPPGAISRFGDSRTLQVRNAQWSHNGNQLELSLNDGSWESWDFASKQRLSRRELPDPEQYRFVSWSGDGQKFAALSQDGQLTLGTSEKILKTIPYTQDTSIFNLQLNYSSLFNWSPDGSTLVVRDAKRNLQLWYFDKSGSAISSSPLDVKKGYLNLTNYETASTLVWSGDSQFLAKVSIENEDKDKTPHIAVYNAHTLAQVYLADVSNNTTGSTSKTGNQTQTSASQLNVQRYQDEMGPETAPVISWSPDGKYMALLRWQVITPPSDNQDTFLQSMKPELTIWELPPLSPSDATTTSCEGNTIKTDSVNSLKACKPEHLERITLPYETRISYSSGYVPVWSSTNRLLLLEAKTPENLAEQYNPVYQASILELETYGNTWHWTESTHLDPFAESNLVYVNWSPDGQRILYNTGLSKLGLINIPPSSSLTSPSSVSSPSNQPLVTDILWEGEKSQNYYFLPSPDGRYFLTLNNDPKQVIYNSADGEMIGEINHPLPFIAHAYNAVWSPDSHYLAVVFIVPENQPATYSSSIHSGTLIQLWQLEENKIPLFKDELYIPGTDYFASRVTWDISNKTPALLFDFETDEIGRWEINQPLPPIEEQHQLALEMPGAAIPGRNVNPLPYFTITGKIAGITGHDDIRLWLPDHKKVISGAFYNFFIRDFLSFEKTPNSEQVKGMALNPQPAAPSNNSYLVGLETVSISNDSRLIGVGLPNGLVNIYDAATGKLVKSFLAKHSMITALKFSPDNHYLAVAGFDGSVTVWDTASWRPLRVLSNLSPGIQLIQWFADSQTLSIVNQTNNGLFWRI